MIMAKFKKNITLLFGILLFSLVVFFLIQKLFVARGSSTDNVRGWSWSENIGWISANCYNDFDGDGEFENCCPGGTDCPFSVGGGDYGLSADSWINNSVDPTNKLSGYAWANGKHLGWICFGESCSGTAPDGNSSWACIGHRKSDGSCTPDCGECFNISGTDDCVTGVFDDLTCPSNGNATTTGLVGWWRFNRLGGTAGGGCNGSDDYCTPDDSGQGNAGTAKNGPYLVAGKWGKAMKFDGSDDYVETSLTIDPSTTSITVEAWVYPKQLPSEAGEAKVVVQQTDGTGTGRSWIYGNTNDTWSSYIGGSLRDSGVSIKKNEWQHVAIVFDKTASTWQFYVNGEKANNGSVTVESADGNWLIGAHKGLANYFFNGLIDNVAIYNYAKSAEEIWDDAHIEISGWAKVETLGDDGWMKLKGQDTSGNWWGVYLNNYDQGGKFYTLDGYSWQTEQSSQPPKTGLGWLKSGYSSSDSAAPLAPLAFDNFSVLNYGCTDNSPNLYLKWTPSTWAERYNYYRCQADSSDDCSTCTYSEYPVSHTACAAAECSQADSGTEQDTGYCYKVIAENETGTTEVTGSPYFKKTGLCAPSEGPAADGTVCGKIKLAWQKGSYTDIDGYNVYRSLTPDGCDTTITTPGIAYGAPYVYDSTTCELIAHAGEAVDAAVDSSGNQHLVAHWKMNGDWTDSSGNGNDGTAHNGATFATGKFNQAGSFDGSDDYVEVADDSSLEFSAGTSFTIESWIKPNTSQPASTAIVTKGYHDTSQSLPWYMLYVNPGKGGVSFYLRDTGGTSYVTAYADILDNKWHHVAGVADASTGKLKLYIDGNLFDDSTAFNTDSGYGVNSDPLVFARHYDNYFNGLIDNVAIYNYARSPQEILRDAEAFPLDETPTETNNTCNITSDITISSATNYTLTCDATTPCCRVFDNRIIPSIPYYYRITVTNPQGESPATEIPSAQLDGCVDASDPTNFRHSCDKSICYPAPSVYEEK